MFQLIQSLSPVFLVVEKAVLALLIFLGMAVTAIFLMRLRDFGRSRGDAARWIKLLTQELRRGVLPSLQLSAADLATVPGRVVKTGLANEGLAPEALEKLYQAQESAEKRDLDRGLSFLATVGSNAPFLGLTGTVIGILTAFERLAASGGKGGTDVMVAISQALIATAIGLIVAIPAVVGYNILRNRQRIILEQSRELRDIILARALQATFGKESA